MVFPMVADIGQLGIGNAAGSILDGKYVRPLDTPPELANVLQRI